MRQRNGSDLFGVSDPRSSLIGIIEVAAEDDSRSILTAILTQNKLQRQQTVLQLPDQGGPFRQSTHFEHFMRSLPELQTRLVLISPADSSLSRIAQQYHCATFATLDDYFQFARSSLVVPSSEEQRKSEPRTVLQTSEGADQQDLADVPTTPISREGVANVAAIQKPDEHVQEVKEAVAPGRKRSERKHVKPRPVEPILLPEPVRDAAPVVPSPALVPVANPSPKRRRWPLWIAILLLCVLLGAMIASAFMHVGPLKSLLITSPVMATITIAPDSQYLSHTYPLSAVATLPDSTQHQIAARFLYASTYSVQTVKTKGLGQSAAISAQGTLTFYNDLPVEQTIPAGTVITDSHGVLLVTDAQATIPRSLSNSVTVKAHAVQPGTAGNIEEHDLDRMLCCQQGVTVSNDDAFKGGMEATSYVYVEQSDIDNAVNVSRALLMQSAMKQWQAQIKSDEQVITPATCTPRAATDHVAGDHAAELNVSVTVTCLGEVYNQSDAFGMATMLLQEEGLRTLGKDYTQKEGISTKILAIDPVDEKGATILHVDAVGLWSYQLSAEQLHALARLIAGKDRSDAQAILQRQAGIYSSTITLSTGQALPTDINRIKMVVQPHK